MTKAVQKMINDVIESQRLSVREDTSSLERIDSNTATALGYADGYIDALNICGKITDTEAQAMKCNAESAMRNARLYARFDYKRNNDDNE